MSPSDELLPRLTQYAQRHALILGEQLGYGMHGIVFVAKNQSGKSWTPMRFAVKVHRRELEYARERDVYLRLQQRGISTVRGCDVPQLLHFDDELQIIAMTLVKRPFLLDFAGAYLDKAPDFSDEVLADWRLEKQEQFEAHWPEVQAILRALEGHGVYMLDINPGNMSFGD
jgi:hypothetical protein